MADKHTYTVHRAMHGDGKDYARGDERELTEAEAAPLVATGALAKKGQKPVQRPPVAVEHTFGAASDGGSVTITDKRETAPAAAKPAAKAAKA